MNNKDLKISIIIPLYNEEKTIIQLLKKIIKFIRINYEIIIVNDGSTDLSLKYIKNFSKNKKKIKVISHKKNLGKGAAIATAKKYLTGNIILIQDADLEYDPKDYEKLIKPIIMRKFKVVYGSRVLNKKRYKLKSFTSLFRIFGNHLLTIISNFFNKQNLTDAHTCYKAFDKRVFDKIKLEEKGFSFCPEVTTKISKLNIGIFEVPISYHGRSYDEGKKIKLSDGISALKTIIKYKFLLN